MNKVIYILLNVTLLLFSFGQLGRISIPGQPVFFYIFELFLVLLLGILILKYHLKPLKKKISQSTMIFISWLSISLLISAFSYPLNQNAIAVLYLLRLSIYFLFLPYIVYFFKANRLNIWNKHILILSSLWIILTSFVQYFLYSNLGNLAYLGWDPHLYRVVGLFFDPPITISVFVLLSIYFFLKFKEKYNWKYLILILPLILLSLLTYSRGGYVGIVITGILFVFFQRKWKYVLVLGIVVISGFLFVPMGSSEGINLLRTTSIGARIEDYRKAVVIWQKNPIIGIGYNHIRFEKDLLEEKPIYGSYNESHGSASFHSSFLVILATGGVVGIVLFVWMLINLARVSEFIRYSIIYLSVISTFDNVLLHPHILFLLFILSGYYVSRPSQT